MNETQRTHFIPRITSVIVWHACVVLACLCLPLPSASSQSFVNFEGKLTNPIRLSPDGSRLFAVNTPAAHLSVFDLSDRRHPALIAEIPVGIEPVSVNARSNDEVWVVNEVSDSVSIVSVSEGIVIATLQAKDEPMDVVFAAGYAFVSLGRSNAVLVFNAETRERVTQIDIFGHYPRSLAVSADGGSVYVVCALSGNRTTLVPTHEAPLPPEPTNPVLPDAPRTGLIVDAADPAWERVVQYTVSDVGVVEIDTATLEVSRHFERIGTVNLGLAVHPKTGDLYVANTDARNLVRFEPQVRGSFQFNRITRIGIGDGEVTPFDLNPDVDYALMPNDAAKATALAQPAGLVFDPSGGFFYVAAFGTDRVAKVDTDGQVMARIEIGDTPGAAVDSSNKRGPRGLALHPQGGSLYVLNRISNTVTVIDTESDTVVLELPVGSYDPTPLVIREGRGFLYDAKLSGNGTVSCASCHVDAEMDMLAWDLGNPGGTMQTLSVHLIDGRVTEESIHPMKGPMVTQTLRGLKDNLPLHWRGDRPTFNHFNPAFDSLMGGAPLSDDDMDRYRAFIETIVFAPNPHRNLDDSLPERQGQGSPKEGLSVFNNFRFDPANPVFTCIDCHDRPSGGNTQNPTGVAGSLGLRKTQPFLVPHFRNIYQKIHFNNERGAVSLLGFGFNHDGELATLNQVHSESRFVNLTQDETRKNDLGAFLMCFDTGTPPAVGYSRTITGASVDDPDVVAEWDVLIKQASRKNIDLIVQGKIGDAPVSYLYSVTRMKYQRNRARTSFLTHANLVAEIRNGATVTLMGVPLGSGQRMALDRDEDGILNGDEL